MPQESKGPFTKIGRWLDDHWINTGLGACSILFAGCCLALSDDFLKQITAEPSSHAAIKKWAFRLIWIVLLGAVFFWFKNLRRSQRISRLEKQVSDLSEERNVLAENVRSLIDGYLVSIASGRLRFGSRNDCSDRITLYSHDDAAKEFVPIGRYSPNPVYRATRRATHPDTEGCLATAWQIGSAFIDDLPDPNVALEEYVTQQAQAGGFPEQEARALTMRSRMYYAYRVMDTRYRTPVAVVVVESTASGRFERPELEQVFNNDERLFMSDLLEALQDHLLVPSDAMKAGF